MILDGVVTAIKSGLSPEGGVRSVAPYVIFAFGLVVAREITGRGRSLARGLIDLRLGYLVTGSIVRKALTLDMRWFEDPAFYDKLQNARRQSEYRAMAVVDNGFYALQNALSLASFLTILLVFNPWVALALCAAGIPAFIVQTRYSRLEFRLQTWRAPETRELNYIEQLLTMDEAVKEVKLFGLGEPLMRLHAETFRRAFSEDAALARARSLYGALWATLSILAYYGAWVWVIAKTIGGGLTLGAMTFYLTLFSQSQGAFQGLLDNVGRLFENGLFLKNLFDFLNLEPKAAASLPGPRPPEDRSRGIEFEDVSFRYPNGERPVLENFSLRIRPGEKLAIVGENGAGKTTLIKLLTRLYEPDKGRVLLNGVDLRHYPLEELHRRIGAIFQDFVRYQRTLAENVGLGAVEKMGDRAAIEAAAHRGGADEVARASGRLRYAARPLVRGRAGFIRRTMAKSRVEPRLYARRRRPDTR